MSKVPGSKLPPSNTAPSGEQIVSLLQQREMLKKSGVALLLVLGLPALLVGPILLSSLYWIVGLLWFYYIPWTYLFLGAMVLLIPLLFWTEWRGGGGYYSDAMQDAFDDDGPMLPLPFVNTISVLGTTGNPRVPAIWLTEVFLWGPRQVLEAIHSIRRMRLFAKVDRKQSAQLLLKLMKTNSIELARLFPNRQADAAMMVGYLVWYEWIGASKENAKIWLDSQSRKVLEKQIGSR